jgi:tetratricopeptide (TPR) repeat protein
MTAELGQVANALGAGQYAECRRLAEALLTGDCGLTVKGQAMGYLVESYVAEGDFATARARAALYGDAEAAARVETLERSYRAEAARLSRLAATGTGEQAASAQLALARTHEWYGRGDLALEAYHEVIASKPHERAAGAALAQIGRIYRQRGQAARMAGLAVSSMNRYPTSAALAAAATALMLDYQLPRKGFAEARQSLSTIVEAHWGTEAAAHSTIAIGDLWLAQDLPEQAARTWATVVDDQSYRATTAYGRAVDKLARVRLDLARSAKHEGHVAEAVALLEEVLKGPHPTELCHDLLLELASGCEEMGRYEDAAAGYERLERMATSEHATLWIRYQRAAALERDGQVQEATRLLESILDAKPNDDRLRAACLAQMAFRQSPLVGP